MRHLLQTIIITIVAFYVAFTVIPTINIGTDPQNLLIIVGGLILISALIKPVFTIILLPINLITFGLLSLVLNFAFFLALTKFLPGFSISDYNFPGATINGFVIPATYLTQMAAIAAIAAIITLIQKLLEIIFQ